MPPVVTWPFMKLRMFVGVAVPAMSCCPSPRSRSGREIIHESVDPSVNEPFSLEKPAGL